MIHILIADDDQDIRESTGEILEASGYNVTTVESGEKAIEYIKQRSFELVILDIKMTGIDGIETLQQIKHIAASTIVIIMTAFGTAESAVKAIQAGAFSFVEKPCYDEIVSIVEDAVKAHNLVEKISASCPSLKAGPNKEIVTASDELLKTFHTIRKLIENDTTVLILGETGTGKGLLAEAIHYNSVRRSEPFVTVNCGAIPENLIESELFGHEKGSFTGAVKTKIGQFEYAGNGTIFLDEIAEFPLNLQVKLLTVIQERKIQRIGSNEQIQCNARIIAATHADLKNAVEQETFRQDLYYRLNVLPVFLPPLRDRKADIILIAEKYVKKFCYTKKIDEKVFSPVVIELLKNYSWPGNIRELENSIEHALVMSAASKIMPNDLPKEILLNHSTEKAIDEKYTEKNIDAAKNDFEKRFIEQSLEKNHGNIEQTAKDIKMESRTLHRRIKKFGIDVSQYRK